MYSKFLILLSLLAATALVSCDAAFDVPVPEVPKAIPLVDTKVAGYPMTGYVMTSKRCNDTLPAGARIIVGWEILNYSQKSFLIYGSGSVEDTLRKILWAYPSYPSRFGYKLDVKIDSNIPQQALFPDANATDVIAVGHLFVTTNKFIKDGDTLSSESFRNSDDILGGIELSAVVYVKGNPKLFTKPIKQYYLTPPDTLNQGFNFLRTWNFIADPKKKMSYIYTSRANKFYLNIEDDRMDTEDYNKFWLFQ
ncbi:MAG: hypothetical protein ABI778_04065 [Ignavibacteriota bacterium]